MRGIVLVSHSYDLANGLLDLLKEVAGNVPITIAGGLDNDTVGTTLPRVLKAIHENEATTLYVFYDLGSALMNVEMAQEETEKTLFISQAAMVEGAFIAASLLAVDIPDEDIKKELKQLHVK